MEGLTGKNNGLCQVATSLLVINVHIVLRELINRHTTLLVIDATPDENLARFSAGNGVVSAAIEFFDLVTSEVLDQGRNKDSIISTLRGWNTGLTEGIETPGIDVAILVDSKTVVVARSNFCDLLALETKLTRNESAICGTSDNTTCELVLLPSSPGKDLSLVVESENMVGTT